ncbi:hypothetical protein ACFX1S_015195 [Malus domestica]
MVFYQTVVTSADFIAAWDQSGCNDFRSATMPTMWGAAIDVPDIKANPPSPMGLAANIFTLGAAISGSDQ